jgi:amino acid adenylation domain-containing protein
MLQETSPIQVAVDSTIDDRAFWLQIISKGISPANINHDYKRSERISCETGIYQFCCDQQTVNKLLKIADNEPSLIFALLCANLSILLYKYTGNAQIVIGVPSLKECNHVNIMPVLSNVKADMLVADFIQTVQSELVETYRHQNFPFDQVLQEITEKPGQDRTTVFDVIISLENIHPVLPTTCNDISFLFNMEDGQLEGTIIYKKELYNSVTIQKLAIWFSNTLKNGIANPTELIKNIHMLSDEEIQTLLVDWNGPKISEIKPTCNHHLFEEHVSNKPQNRALVCGGQHLTYFELDQRADQLAALLISKGISNGDLVGIYTDRSIEMIVGVMGVLKSGAAYVPFDPSYPTDRIKLMLDSAELKVIVAQKKYLRLLTKMKKDLPVIVLEDFASENPGNLNLAKKTNVTGEDLAYVIYTSGSTGTPKCAGVFQKGWRNLLHWFTTEFGIKPQDKSLLISSFGFDITQRTLMMPLIAGAELHLYNRVIYDPAEILDIIDEQQITILNCTPSTFYPLVELNGGKSYDKLKSLRYLFLGGEPIAAGRLKDWAQSSFCNCDIVNVYGVTECADVSSFYILQDFDKYEVTGVPIGKPIYNTELFVLNENLDLIPVGVEGELFIAGEGVGKGYINDSELTRNKFSPNSIGTTGQSMYRTGDVVKYRPDGVLTYAGRKDYQIKIRGHRVDLGEVESIINAQPIVKEAIVLVKDNITNGKELHCYFIATGEQSDNLQLSNSEYTKSRMLELWKQLRDILPGYMVPDYYCVLNEMPLNPNGKIDRGALKNLPVERVQIGNRKIELPNTATEEFLFDLYKKILNQEQISITDDFFLAGGHSLTATQLVAQINEKLKLNLRVADIISRATVQKLGAYLDSLN